MPDSTAKFVREVGWIAPERRERELPLRHVTDSIGMGPFVQVCMYAIKSAPSLASLIEALAAAVYGKHRIHVRRER